MRLVLDTGCIRNLIHRSEPQIDFELLVSAGSSIASSIAEPALVELLTSIHEQRVVWDEWRVAASSLDRILDADLPFLPGRRQLAELVTEQLSNDEIQHIRAGWRHIVESETAEQLRCVSSYLDSSGNERHLRADLDTAQEIRTRIHQDWIDFIRHMQEILGGQQMPNPRIEAIVRQGFEPISGVPLDSVDAAVRFLARFVVLSVNGREPYNPESNPSDSLDFELLYALALPQSVICTTDQRLMNITGATGSPQASRIIGVPDLNRRLGEGSLTELVRTSSM